MPYNEHDKKVYNKGFYSGAKYMTMRIVAFISGYEKPQCFKCGNKKTTDLEIHHINGVEESKYNRNFDDWVDIGTLELLCRNPCHAETDGYRRKF